MDKTIKGICLFCGEEVEVDRMALANVGSTIKEFVASIHGHSPQALKERIVKIKSLLKKQNSKSRCARIDQILLLKRYR